MAKLTKVLSSFVVLILLSITTVKASHISGIRITQTGNTGLMINVDITAFYTTGSTTANAYLGTYYNAIPAIDWGDGSTTPRYGYGPSTGIPLVATSTVVNGIPARSYRGSFSHTYGSTGSYTISANTRCCPQTTPTYTLVTGTILNSTITTTGVFGPTTFTTSFVQNTLGVTGVAPVFTKEFSGNVGVGEPTTLTFIIANNASTLDAGDLDFTNNLPAGLVVATPANIVNSCTGGTVTAVSDSSTISYTGGTVAAGTVCDVSVDTVAAEPGIYDSTSGDLTSTFGNSGTAMASVTVTANAPGFNKSFAPVSTGVGVLSTLTFSIDNTTNMAAVTSLDFTDNLPAGLLVATPANIVNNCVGGTVTATSDTSVISYTNGQAPANASCTISVDTVAVLPGIYANTSGDLTSNFGNSGTASDSLTVTATPPVFAKAFMPTSTAVGAPSTLIFTIDNSANSANASALDFTDNLPAGLVVATPSNAVTTCTGGTITAVEGSGSVSYTNGVVSSASTCTVSVDTVATAVGMYANTSGDLSSVFGNSGTASDTLTVTAVAPAFAKVFAPDTVGVGMPSTLTFTIDNSANLVAATALDFTDNLPAGLVIATPANTNNTCTGGTLTASSGTSVISYTNGSVAASSTCTISVDTLSDSTGTYDNLSGDLTSVFGNSGTAADSLIVSAMPLVFSKAFAPEVTELGQTSVLTFTIDNSGNLSDATELDFSDTFPTGMIIADPVNTTNTCTGGTLTANAGAASVSYTMGSVAGSATCTISVGVVTNGVGEFNNVSGNLTSGFGDSGNASATLSVGEVLGFNKAFAPDMVAINEVSTLTFTIDNSTNPIDVDNVNFVDNLPADMIVATPANATTSCLGGTLSAVEGSSTISYTSGSLAANTMCTVVVDVIGIASGLLENNSGDLTSDFGNSGIATASLTVASAPLFSKAFSPDNLIDNFVTTLTFTIDNSANGIDATDLAFVDNMPAGMIVADEPNVLDSCTGGTVVANIGDGTISYSGGMVSASSVCTISVDVMVADSGNFNNVAGPLSSSLGASSAASATDNLMVSITRIIPSLSLIGLMIMVIMFLFSYHRRRKQEV